MPEDALPAISDRQRVRGDLLGGRYHRAGVLRRHGGRTLAAAVLLGRLVIAVVGGLIAAILLRERTARAIAELEEEHHRKAQTAEA